MNTPGIPPHDKTESSAPFDWRQRLAVHAATELFPPLPEAELRELAEDIRLNGLRAPLVSWDGGDGPVLLDGRNRLDALALAGLLYETGDRHVGLKTWNGTKWCDASGDRIQFHHVHGDDPYVLACSLNIRRRHLTAEQKRDLIAKLVKATPEKSNRLIAHQVKVSHPTVAKVRKQLEQAGDVEKVSTSIDSKGRKQPAKKSKLAPKKTAKSKPGKAEYAAADTPPTDTKAGAGKPEHKGVSAKDTALFEFDGHVLRLLQMTNKARPGRFALRTSVSAADLRQLAGFLTEVASERPAGLMKAEHPARDMEPSS
jgi:hypothetical protein